MPGHAVQAGYICKLHNSIQIIDSPPVESKKMDQVGYKKMALNNRMRYEFSDSCAAFQDDTVCNLVLM